MLMKELNHFGDCSGLRISFAKSSILSTGICSSDLEEIMEITGFTQGSFPFRYLGIPVADSRLSIAQFSPFIDKISNYINDWAGSSISYTSRTELVRNFLWGGKCNVFKQPLVAWKEITLPKIEGGFGIRNPKVWNKALLSKILWDIQSKKDSLWVHWVHHFYLKCKSFWAYKIKYDDSPLSKQIIALRDELIAFEETKHAAIQKLNQWSINGEMQSKLAYDHFRPRGIKLKWPKIIWNSNTIPKQAFIFWLGMKGKLLTKDRLHDPQVIKESRGTGVQAKMKKLALASSTYFLWEARNLRIFEGKVQSPKAGPSLPVHLTVGLCLGEEKVLMLVLVYDDAQLDMPAAIMIFCWLAWFSPGVEALDPKFYLDLDGCCWSWCVADGLVLILGPYL
ncbi:hypothetical protein Acr_24g0005230 [Actinidia rufa]|uniref:Reverse transcriptase zinc-binding domain-containing protein n=1 Tax=Actinidia rufa TaxID=165716 RepID=A0A7J0GU63_9ERIC|nr:hypothetical protein Acr_24g0005230 [Actinidia rufa]